MHKIIFILTIASFFSIADWAATNAFAQDAMSLIVKQAQMQENFFDRTASQIQESRQRNILLYRQATGDHESTDIEAARQLDLMSRAANPFAFSEMHNNAIADRAQTFHGMHSALDAYNNAVELRIRQSRDLSERSRQFISDRTTEMIRGQNRFVNPTTGQITTLPTYQPYQPHTNPTGNIFLQNRHGQYRSFTPDGNSSTQLNVYHGW